MRKQKHVEINGDDFMITQFGARKGIKLGKKVAKVVLPAMGALYGRSDGVSDPALSDVLAQVAEHLDELDDETIMELLSETTVNKYQIDFDNYFAGNYGALFHVLWEIIEFNFADIFSELPGTEE